MVRLWGDGPLLALQPDLGHLSGKAATGLRVRAMQPELVPARMAGRNSTRLAPSGICVLSYVAVAVAQSTRPYRTAANVSLLATMPHDACPPVRSPHGVVVGRLAGQPANILPCLTT